MSGALEELGEEDAGAFLGLPAALAVTFGQCDEGVARVRNFGEELQKPLLVAGAAAVLERVQIAARRTGAGARTAPAPGLPSSRRLFGARLEAGGRVEGDGGEVGFGAGPFVPSTRLRTGPLPRAGPPDTPSTPPARG